MQDFTGVPCIVDLATMREAIVELGGDASKVNPLAPAELVIDHSVIADVFGTKDSFEQNTNIEYERNQERYRFLRWGQNAFDEFKVVPPGTGIVHQVNIEYLARVVMAREVGGVLRAYPIPLLVPILIQRGYGPGFRVGVGGIEARPPAEIYYQCYSTCSWVQTHRSTALWYNSYRYGARLRDFAKVGVVGKFVEFFGSGVACVPMADRTTIEYEPSTDRMQSLIDERLCATCA